MSTTLSLTTTSHQQHTAQLAEYDALITSLRDAKANAIALPGIFLSLQPHSPLAQEHDSGQAHLQKLLETPDYLDLRRSKGASTRFNFLSVVFRDGRAVYETADAGGNSITLPLNDHIALRSLAGKIEKTALNIGGQIRSDRLLSLSQILWYYGLQPEQPQNADTLSTLILELEERRANHLLGLENGLDLGNLIRQTDHRPILDAVSLILEEDETSVLESLGKEALANITGEQLRANPAVYLDRLLNGSKARRLATQLLGALDWYGAGTGEDTDPNIEARLVAEAIRRWYSLTGDEPDDTIARFRLEQPSNWGKSYQTLRSEFEAYLIDSDRVTTPNEAILLARLLLPQLPSEFQVRDIPQDLPYRSSAVWVNFVHGVTLAEAMKPDAINRMSFQQLVDFPLQQAMQANQQELELIALCRLPPTLEWAIAAGVIAQKTDSDYSAEEKALAVKALDDHSDALREAIIQMDVHYPERSAIADGEIKTYFKDALHMGHDGEMEKVWGENRTFFAFISDGRKLIEDFANTEGGGILQPPPLKNKIYTFKDVYISGALNKNRSWFITSKDGIHKSRYKISLNADRTLKTDAPWLPASLTNRPLPDINKLFESTFNNYLELSKNAYQTLLKSQFASLPYVDRRAIERGEVKIYTLRKPTSNLKLEDETSEITLPLRLRMGFILQISYESRVSHYECLPRSGIIRRRTDFSLAMLNGKQQAQQIKGSILGNTDVIKVRRGKSVPFDWAAHETGSFPKKNARCDAIIEQLGNTFTASTLRIESEQLARSTVTTSRAMELATFIARNFFYYDEKLLRAAAWGETEIERIVARPHWLDSVKGFIPFWGSITDLLSGDPNKKGWAIFGLIVDVVSFAFPLGKFVSGSVKLVSITVRSGVRATLPRFGVLTEKLLVSSVQNVIPFYGLPTLALRLSGGVLRSLYAGVKFAVKKSYNSLKPGLGRAGKYSFIEGLPQATDPGHWKPLAQGDQLGSVYGIEDIAIRRTNSGGTSSYHLIAPLSGKPYGPRLTADIGELSIGRSGYSRISEVENKVIFDIPENARVHQIPEVDGRTTLLIDEIPYRLDQGALRRVDTIDASKTLLTKPCRVRRGVNEVCLNSFVYRKASPTPEPGSFDPVEDFCPWFGDRIYTPAPVKPGRLVPVLALDGQLYTGSGETLKLFTGKKSDLGLPKRMLSKARLEGTIEFQKGIYGRIRVKGVQEGLDDDMRQVSTLIIESKLDAKKEYLFTQLNATDYYFAEIAKGQSLTGSHRLQRIPDSALQSDPVYKELFKVFTGSMQANNTVAIYGVEKVKEALRTMDEIAIPLGGLANPPATMTRVKVSTTPGQAVMFDHQTRMIVCKFPVTTKAWTRSKEAPELLRERTARIFNTLFDKPLYKPNERNTLQISNAMKELQTIIKKKKSMDRPRNIAYAEVSHADGNTEVYVSVSGSGGDTGFLPLFAKQPHAKEVKIGNTTYINVDHKTQFPRTSLHTTAEGQFQAVPRTIDNMATYTPELTLRPTSLDSESKLIRVIREKYPNDATRSPVTVATTMAPCDSCSVVMQQFAHTGGKDALKVIWD